MTVLVTGAFGGSGRWIVDRLASEGREVVAVDQRRGRSDHGNVVARQVDLTDRGDVFDLCLEFEPDDVVHWGAIPDPTGHAGGHVFENNVMGAYNVFDAAGRVGADVVWASSESAYGFPFAAETPLPDYLPVDEDHPLRPEDSYGASKVAGEDAAEMVVRRDGISVASIRPSWIQYPGRYQCKAGDPMDGGDGNFWSYVDVRDIVDSVVAAMDADFDGHEPFLIAAADNYVGRPTADLVEDFFGELPERVDLTGDESAMSSAKAQAQLDWEPTRSWREAAEEDVEGPAVYAE
ncbi:NAD-dependent epimerase/dehydratase family protein [Halomicrobium salinisoli]|uniref:NAD-dependent epimerase/dehydratase family protein n=1 Tax=Halomicrobium salinisoli TaxID=2878391 RepID=UPI001CEFC1A1|nr:NAD(P)-dependent oxidoreductase [Halomicrobium salinisoli]